MKVSINQSDLKVSNPRIFIQLEDSLRDSNTIVRDINIDECKFFMEFDLEDSNKEFQTNFGKIDIEKEYDERIEHFLERMSNFSITLEVGDFSNKIKVDYEKCEYFNFWLSKQTFIEMEKNALKMLPPMPPGFGTFIKNLLESNTSMPMDDLEEKELDNLLNQMKNSEDDSKSFVIGPDGIMNNEDIPQEIQDIIRKIDEKIREGLDEVDSGELFINPSTKVNVPQKETPLDIDDILDKISESGMNSLTKREKEFLDKQ